MKKEFVLMLFLAGFACALSDSTGMKAGTSEEIQVSMWNSTTGSWINDASCKLFMYFPNKTMSFSNPMNFSGIDGTYNYSWASPSAPLGKWHLNVNCTSSQENRSGGRDFNLVDILDSEKINQTLNYSIAINSTQTILQNTINGNFSNIQSNFSTVIGKNYNPTLNITVNVTQNNSYTNYTYDNWLNTTYITNVTYNITQNNTITNNTYDNSYNYSYNFTYLTNMSVVVNVTANNTIANTTTIQQVDLTSLNKKIDDSKEDIMRLLREILDYLKGFDVWKMINPFR